ncbi:MAG TPA: hypothetical protein VHH36_05410 [Candidatus Thermoplasmatota archaeon]|nr:hypothetical protein [Candidatus Thermoplasmatota archaeon]
MARRLLLLAALVALAPLAAAALSAPEGAAQATVAGAPFAAWVGNETNASADVAPGANATLRVLVGLGEDDAARNATALVLRVNVSSPALLWENASRTTEVALLPNGTLQTSFPFAFAFAAPNETGRAGYNVTVERHARDANGTLVLLGSGAFAGEVAVVAPVAPEAPGLPLLWIALGGAVVVAGGAGAVAMRRRAVRARMNRAPRRSQAMREIAAEKELERADEKDPERAEEIRTEMRAQEKVREKRRELQILEAKRADALKTIDLIRKRHESGAITRLQHDNMVAKKQADLQRIEAEIAAMEAEGDQPGAAA